MGATVKVSVQDNTGQVLKAAPTEVRQALAAMSLQCINYAKMKCPVDTGRLRNSITYSVEDKTAVVGTNVDYAVYVEEDDSKKHKTGSAHFLRSALADHVSEYQAIFKAYFGVQ